MLCAQTMRRERLRVTVGCLLMLGAAPAAAQPAPPPAPGALPVPGPLPPPVPPPAPPISVELTPNQSLAAPGDTASLPPAPPTDALEPPEALEPPQPQHPPRRVDLAVSAGPPPDIRPLQPIRARRRISLMHEICWNGLAGFGPILTYHATAHLAADFGAGFSLLGWKMGARARYNFLTSAVTPFAAVGANYASGFGRFTANPSSDSTTDTPREPVTIDQRASYLIQGVIGFDFMHRRGFNMLGTMGWAWLLNEDNYEVLAGKLTAEEEQGFKIAFKGGPVLGLSMGYAFE
jgi:hypothetical protein